MCVVFGYSVAHPARLGPESGVLSASNATPGSRPTRSPSLSLALSLALVPSLSFWLSVCFVFLQSICDLARTCLCAGAELPIARRSHTLVRRGQELVMLGGTNGTHLLGEAWSLNLDTFTWSRAPPNMAEWPVPSFFHTSVVSQVRPLKISHVYERSHFPCCVLLFCSFDRCNNPSADLVGTLCAGWVTADFWRRLRRR